MGFERTNSLASRYRRNQPFRPFTQTDLRAGLERGGGVTWAPIINDDCIRWRRYTIDAALTGGDIELSEYMIKILDHLDALLIQNDHHVIDFLLASGDFLIMDNHRCLHSRSAISNPNTQRLMLRGWVE